MGLDSTTFILLHSHSRRYTLLIRSRAYKEVELRRQTPPPLLFSISSSSIHKEELQPVHFCICWRDSAVLNGYLFRQWPACMHVPNWKNVLGVSTVV